MNEGRRCRFPWPVSILAFAFAASGSQAAEQGRLGPTSTGSISISLSTAPRITAAGARELVLSEGRVESGGIPLPICFAGNAAVRNFSVTAVDGGDTGSFELVSGDRTARYGVILGEPGAGVHDPGSLFGAAPWLVDCGKGGNPSLVITIDRESREAIRTGEAFIGVLTLLVVPG
jgi:hypothetical protein